MHEVRLMQFFLTGSPTVSDECDRLMDALVDLEDDTVRDAAVSLDAEKHLVVVEVYARGRDRTEAEINALTRIHTAMVDHVGLQVEEVAAERRVEDLVPA